MNTNNVLVKFGTLKALGIKFTNVFDNFVDHFILILQL